jgi:hypothetical protein
MGVDLAKQKQRQKEEEQKTAARAAGGFKFWSPAVGENRVRFMPPWTEEGPNANDFAREVYVHWNVGPEEKGVTFSCPAKTPDGPGSVCPVCNFVKQLRATEDAADQEIAADIAAKQRFYSNIVDLSDPLYVAQDIVEWKAKSQGNNECPFTVGETKMKVFSYGPMIFKDLLDIFADNIDITDLQTGWDVKITREGKGRQTRYRVRLDSAKGQSPFVFEAKDSIEKRLVNLDNLMPYKTVEDMENAIKGSLPASQLPPAGTPPPQLPAQTQALPDPEPAKPDGGNGVQIKPAVQITPEPEEEEEPPCFKDTEYFDEKDVECVGGDKDNEEGIKVEYERCPFFAECKAHCKPPKKRRGRRKAAKAKSAESETEPEVDELEAEMKSALK